MRSKLFFLFAALTLGVLLAACQPQATPTARPTAVPSATTEATEAVTEEATEAATEEATADAESATEEATEAATEEATEVATDEATEEATEAVAEVTEEGTEVAMAATTAPTEEATEMATEEATEMATEEATEAATETPTEEATEEVATGFGGIESVCLVTDVGRVNDGTFNQFAYEGMQRAAEDLGLENTFIETQAQTDYATNISTCLDEGYDAVVTVGFLIADATLAAAEANPGTLFIGVDQFVAEGPANYVGIQFREDQAGFLVGALAALVTESGTIAGVYGIDIPPVIKFRNGYEQGARYINPDINVLGVYIDSFTAPDRGAAAAEQFIGDGADVVFGAGGPTGSGAIAFAATAGAWVIGVDQDEYGTTFGGGETPGADRLISSALKRVDNGVYQLLEIAAGSDETAWPGGGLYVLEVANDGIGFAEAHDAEVSEEVTARVTEILDGIRDGSIETGVDPVTGALLEPIVAPTDEATEEATEAVAEPTEAATEEATEEATEAVAEATEEATEVAMASTPTPTEEATEEATEAVAEATEEATEEVATGFGGIESVCLVTDVGRVNDGTFNQFAYEGMQRAAEDLGLENTFIETQAQTDYATNISTCLDEGYDAVVTVGFLIADATLAAAEANPGTLFIGVDQFVAEGPANYVGIQFREDQAGFLVGALAALVTESGTIAGVYGIDIPPVIKFRNGYEQGARYINPDINVLGVYIDSFTAPDRGAAAAEQFIGDGADVVFGAGGPTGSGAIAFAATAGAWVIGVDQDEYGTTFGGGETPGADRLISSALKRVDNGVYQLLEIAAGSDETAWPGGGLYVLEVANDGIGFAEAHDAEVSDEVTAQVTEILEGIRDGSIETGVDPVTGALLETAEATEAPAEAATEEATAEATATP